MITKIWNRFRFKTTAADPAILATPAIPTELWMFWDATIDEGRGGWITAVDHGVVYLTCFDEDQAREAAEYQNELYDLECIPVRVK